MKIHKNAKLTPKARLELSRSVVRGATLVQAAEQFRVSVRTAAKWVARFKAGGEAALGDRSSRPHALWAVTPVRTVRRIERLRRQRLTIARISAEVGVSRSTVQRVLAKAGLSKLSELEPEEPVLRYEREHPGELLHIDIKKLGHIVRPGHRVTGSRHGQARGVGWDTVFIAIDDHSRVAFADLIQSALREWAYGFVYRTSAQRSLMLHDWLHHYNWHRPHASLGARPPMSRIPLSANNLLRLHS